MMGQGLMAPIRRFLPWLHHSMERQKTSQNLVFLIFLGFPRNCRVAPRGCMEDCRRLLGVQKRVLWLAAKEQCIGASGGLQHWSGYKQSVVLHHHPL